MSDPPCSSLEDVLRELETIAPEVPLLALGQTIFWDEPMKAGVNLKLRRIGSRRTYLAGIHDSDYFAKLPGGRTGQNRFITLPHNDTTTRGLWSAAGEFSALFGSETVITRDALIGAGVRVDAIVKQRPRFLDEITEAWGWRGIVSLEDSPPITAELPMQALFPELRRAFQWASDSTLQMLNGQTRSDAEAVLAQFNQKIEAAEAESTNLSEFYRKLLPSIYELVCNGSPEFGTTSTTELLRFNRKTWALPRFELLELFVNCETREAASRCYDDAIQGSAGLYELPRFGTGAIPFDMIIPGNGRGTIRIGNRGVVIMTPKRQFISLRRPLRSLQEFAQLVESKFGEDVVIVGKAVSLIGMLAREFVFVFHEGASGYVRYSRALHRLIEQRLDRKLTVHPVLRVRYSAWDSLQVCCSWLRLPEVMQRAFGTEELCAPSFAGRWREVSQEQTTLIDALSKIRRPIELIRYLDTTLGGSWRKLAEEYESLFGRLQILRTQLEALHDQRDALYTRLRKLKRERVEHEKKLGEHFRGHLFERDPSPEATLERSRLHRIVGDLIDQIHQTRSELRKVRASQHQLAEDPEIKAIYDRRRSIGLEAELKKARLIREAIVSSKGLAHAAVRPAAWWFPLLCPDGLWFRETVDSACAYLEPLL